MDKREKLEKDEKAATRKRVSNDSAAHQASENKANPSTQPEEDKVSEAAREATQRDIEAGEPVA